MGLQAAYANLHTDQERDFFFQAEDGIRDDDVTGVQTCALPIWTAIRGNESMAVNIFWMSTVGGICPSIKVKSVALPMERAIGILRRKNVMSVTKSTDIIGCSPPLVTAEAWPPARYSDRKSVV